MSDTGSGSAALQRCAPAVAVLLDRLARSTPVEPGLTVGVRRRCAAALELAPLPGTTSIPVELDPAIGELAEQFSLDVARIDDEQRAALAAAAGDQLFAVVQAIYVADMCARARAVLDALFGPSDWGGVVEVLVVDEGVHWQLIDALMVEVHRLSSLDPVLSEHVRLHGARQHRCRLCMSLRSRPALIAAGGAAPFDELVGQASSAPSDRDDEARRVAIDLVDAMIWTPARVAPEVLERSRTVLGAERSVEVVLDVVRNGANKIAVALAADAAHVEQGIEVYEVDGDGVAHYGLSAP